MIIFGWMIKRVGSREICKECGSFLQPITNSTLKTARKGLSKRRDKKVKELEETRPYSSTLNRM